ncbi:uncharacterized protein H6S33_007054 [Morchella sextelata]|uniref:uncharacterized protein n=1 Tax=Morchella sextelata TaxID=1174677 RepID=UPI001D054A2F|nr:uncharacterized protein H6S33_007054 [Morchella sextelata]KAH0604023.1 hypothetical protein H6S33_007054 [Morchella sextelata]
MSTLTHVLPSIDYLLAHYNNSLEKYHDNPQLSSMLQVGLRKLEKYFNKTDSAPAYIAAVVLNPAWKWEYFQTRWTREQVIAARRRLKQYWETLYKDFREPRNQMPGDSPYAAGDRSDFDLWYQLDYVAVATGMNEYTQYCACSPEPDISDPRSYWMSGRSRTLFPNLSRMALDILSIPAMSAEPERLFSGQSRRLQQGVTVCVMKLLRR